VRVGYDGRVSSLVRLRYAAAMALGLAVLTACRPAGPVGPTPVPEPPSVRNLPGRGIVIEGHGSMASDDVAPEYSAGLPVGVDVVTITHDGRSSFIVTAIQNDRPEQLTAAIGAYNGQRPLVVQGPVSFEVTADGAWSLRVQPMSSGGQPAFSGKGDAVSAYFQPPQPGSWGMQHDGQSSFFVFAHCLSGSTVVADRNGAFQDTTAVDFGRGPCFWEVRADGAWSLTPPA
jgi:hypothetical protein